MPSKKTAKKSTAVNESLIPSDAHRVHLERGDFLLPQIVDYIYEHKWIDPRPIYQRRLVWDNKRKSLFLESLFLNLPVPPLFLFEHKYGEWEIMDGQQRSRSIVDFYKDTFRISGLKRCKELNGKTYSQCSSLIQKSFDRRRIQVTTILAESAGIENFDVRKEVFERLNTGGKPLNAQEIRNCLHAGKFCDLLDELSSHPVFTKMWGIPQHAPPKDLRTFSPELLGSSMFSRMVDCELVLRFFAFEKTRFLSGSTKTALDKCMAHYHSADDIALAGMRNKYLTRIALVNNIFGDDAFMLPSGSASQKGAKKIYDCLMSAIGHFEQFEDKLVKRKKQLRIGLSNLKKNEDTYDILITQHDSKKGFNDRVDLVSTMIRNEIN